MARVALTSRFVILPAMNHFKASGRAASWAPPVEPFRSAGRYQCPELAVSSGGNLGPREAFYWPPDRVAAEINIRRRQFE